MKVAIFFDGKNFYSGFKDCAQGGRINFTKLAQWLVERAKGTVLAGCHYYTGIETGIAGTQDGQRELAGFLEMLELQPGFFVYRFPRKARTFKCISCKTENRFTQEKEVDTTMVADMLRLAAVNAFDTMVLVSGDADHAPAVEGVRAMGKIVYVSTWGSSGLAPRIRKAAFDHIDMITGLPAFSESECTVVSEAQPPIVPIGGNSIAQPSATCLEPLSAQFLNQLRAAEEQFKGGYVGVNFFVTRWKAPGFDAQPAERRRVFDRLSKSGDVEIYDAKDGNKALRIAIRKS
jgi:uncharacterized LabA/DUF88 family protein